MEITKDKITEIFCIIDDFCKEYDAEIEKNGNIRTQWTQAQKAQVCNESF